MSNLFFKFKHFTVWHDRCAMKVGTDGVLLGAWVPQGNYRRILDVGTGTGLVALMLAQRMPEAKIVGVEIDAAASEQARENVSRTEWTDRIEIECCDFRNYQSKETFNLIVSNPPYFIDALKCPAEQRSVARHAGSMNYDLLFRRSASLLHPDGQICVIIPSEIEKNVVDAAWNHHLYPCRRLRVYTKPGKPCRRVLLAFSFKEGACADDVLCIEAGSGQYTAEYIALTRDFYLKM